MTDLAVAEPAAPDVADTPDALDAAAAPGRAAVAQVADSFVGLMRSFNKARAQMIAAAAHDVEWSAHVALKCLQNEGPMRAGALAECLHSDPSTVSRQVAAMVKDGLLERRADPEDGRASLLVLTDKAQAVLVEHDRIRIDYFAEMLADWDLAELHSFQAMLERFTTDYNNTHSDQMAQRVRDAIRAEGTNR